MKPRLTLFDYCDTLFDGQSLQQFINYLYAEVPGRRWKKWTAQRRLRSIQDSTTYKAVAFQTFAGLQRSQIQELAESFFTQVLWPKHHESMLERMYEHERQGDEIIILSGGLDEYL